MNVESVEYNHKLIVPLVWIETKRIISFGVERKGHFVFRIFFFFAFFFFLFFFILLPLPLRPHFWQPLV